ncbi:hypothetical protein [Clostridium butyricum]|uniref:hypothetical protein n=1 Tax=Clostridium butyricum TaxID=1492 RepID=UPI00137677AE|nr:hypothetical protein [Clostridium butyricum]MBZ0314320.1 hypothetical protein [Clostridium butyricum]MBZ5746753.1 hypothetical protein [Clostridium butyricum]
MRKLNELNFNENYKIKAIDDLNNVIKYYKKYAAYYKFNRTMAYFEIFKISNSEE